MSRRQRRSKGPNSKREQLGDSKALRPVIVGASAPRSTRKWGLLAVVGITVLVVAGSYYWFDFESPPLEPLGANSQADFYRRVLASDPENDEAHYNLGLLLQSQGKLDEAVFHYRRAIEMSGDDASYHNNLGAALADLREFDEAVEHFNRAITLDNDFAEAHVNLGNALFSQEKLEDAIVHFRRAIELKPDYVKAHNNLAVALKQMGHLDEAYRHRFEAMRLEQAQKVLGTQVPVRND